MINLTSARSTPIYITNSACLFTFTPWYWLHVFTFFHHYHMNIVSFANMLLVDKNNAFVMSLFYIRNFFLCLRWKKTQSKLCTDIYTPDTIRWNSSVWYKVLPRNNHNIYYQVIPIKVRQSPSHAFLRNERRSLCVNSTHIYDYCRKKCYLEKLRIYIKYSSQSKDVWKIRLNQTSLDVCESVRFYIISREFRCFPNFQKLIILKKD